jgi:hypothetical protein
MTDETLQPEAHEFKEYWKDGKGNLIHHSNVDPAEALEDALVATQIGFARELNAQIARFREHCFGEITTFLDILHEKYGAKRGGKKGNMTFLAFDGLSKITIQVAEHFTFGPSLKVAKSLIDECIADWASDARPEIRDLIDHAFRPDKEGNISLSAVLDLRRVKIEDQRWKRAIDAINDSLRVVGSKSYIRFYARPDMDSRWSAITIDLASADAPATASEGESA